jgi:hypothetical protein
MVLILISYWIRVYDQFRHTPANSTRTQFKVGLEKSRGTADISHQEVVFPESRIKKSV